MRISDWSSDVCSSDLALMSRPKMILLDEPSMGLAPQLVESIFETVKRLNEEEGVSFLLAEQNTNVALRYARYGYILESGRVVLDGDAERSEEHTSELQSLMRITYAVFCLKKKKRIDIDFAHYAQERQLSTRKISRHCSRACTPASYTISP